MDIEEALKSDAADLAVLINLAGEGIPAYLWSGMATEAQTVFDIGTQRAAREEGGFSYHNARVIRRGSEVAGMILAYRLHDPYEIGDIKDFPEVVRPLVELEALVPGSWYINAIASKEIYRGQGIASALMAEAEGLARSRGSTSLSLIVASENLVARNLYHGLGYERLASRPVIDYPGAMHGGAWELMVKAVGG